MKKAVLFAFLLLPTLQGCSIFDFCRKPDPPPWIPPEAPKAHLDPRALEPCLPLQKLSTDNPQYIDILHNVEENVKVYVDCATKQDNSIKLLKKFANIEDKP